jgi:diketogulonate reductase-like aldo/keto reductase
MITSITDCTVLNNGVKMPWLGFGVFKTKEGEEVINSVKWALEAGYRSIDTAMVYRNEVGVGKAIKESGVPREEIFLTTKLWNTDVRERRTLEAFNESLERLEVDYVDLYLIHWPVKDGYIEAWKAMESIYASGRAKAIGISNFMIEHLDEFLPECSVTPAVNQVEFHPFLVQPNLLKYCQEHKIQVEAYSPIARGEVVSAPNIRKLAERYQKTPAQVVLRWEVQHDVVTIPKSVHKERIIENAQIFDFELSDEDMAFLDSMDEGRRVGSDPYTFTF